MGVAMQWIDGASYSYAIQPDPPCAVVVQLVPESPWRVLINGHPIGHRPDRELAKEAIRQACTLQKIQGNVVVQPAGCGACEGIAARSEGKLR